MYGGGVLKGMGVIVCWNGDEGTGVWGIKGGASGLVLGDDGVVGNVSIGVGPNGNIERMGLVGSSYRLVLTSRVTLVVLGLTCDHNHKRNGSVSRSPGGGPGKTLRCQSQISGGVLSVYNMSLEYDHRPLTGCPPGAFIHPSLSSYGRQDLCCGRRRPSRPLIVRSLSFATRYWLRPAGWGAHDPCQVRAPRVSRGMWRQVQFTLVVPANTSLVSWSEILHGRSRQGDFSVGWKGLPGEELPAVGEFGILTGI
ncbi:hypothetical protein L2E82_39065 [Cichorium intybus]|uniref:Uncharacterized protein n=1 Tax=Cichorium intybus TaxID=13427 RepID=A0ACB9AI36_CICIN|nr:hypothetical protein L2E82_39065 [Cichorium intybus]